jgi:hypothetical protein
MLKKLIKYEFKATARIFFMIYALLVAMAAINHLLLFAGDLIDDGTALSMVVGIIQGIAAFIYGAAVISSGIVTVVIILIRFYRNLLGDEGHLMFTLPVAPRHHLLSKLIVSTVWAACTVAVIILSLTVIFLRFGLIDGIRQFVAAMASEGFEPFVWIIGIGFLILMGIICGIMQLYCAMCIGPHVMRSRLGGSIIAYIVIYVITQIFAAVCLLGYTLVPGIDALQLWLEQSHDEASFTLGFGDAGVAAINGIGIASFFIVIIPTVILGIASYLVSCRMLDKKLAIA